MSELIYDIRHLIRVFDLQNSSKTGIYRLEIDLLEELLDSGINLILYCEDRDKSKINLFDSFINKRFRTNYCYQYNLNNIKHGVFFSPIFSIPNELLQKSSIKKVIMVHDIMPLKLFEYSHVAEKGTWFYSVIQNLKSTEILIVVPSQFTKNDLLTLGVDASRITVCPHGLNQRLYQDINIKDYSSISIKKYLSFKYNFPEKEYFFSIGTITSHKNLLRQLQAFKQILEEGKDVIFVFGGALTKINLEYTNQVFKIVEQNPNHIIYIGYVDDSDIKFLYANAIALVFTSEYEGFGFPALEAMRVGCPVITSKNSAVSEIVGKTGIQINHKSLDEHRKAYNILLNNFSERLRLTNLARDRSFKFSYTDNLICYIKSLL